MYGKTKIELFDYILNNWIKAIPQFYNDNDQILYYDNNR